jgi:hypothetical protein
VKKLLPVILLVLLMVFATSGCYVSVQVYPNITGYWTFVTGGTDITVTQLIHIWGYGTFGALGGYTEDGPYIGNNVTGSLTTAKFGIPASMMIEFEDVTTGHKLKFTAELTFTELVYGQTMEGEVTLTVGGVTVGDTFTATWVGLVHP